MSLRRPTVRGRHLWWTLLGGVLVAAIVITGVLLPWGDTPGAPAAGKPAPGAPGANTLVLYDQSAYPEQSELYAIHTANLASHFGEWTAAPVDEYEAGDMGEYDAVIYVGSVYDEPLPEAFLDDVLTGATAVLWIRDNLWQLTDHAENFADRYGFSWDGFDDAAVAEVRYKDTSLTRDPANESGLAQVNIHDRDKVETVATAVREDGSTAPWAVRSGNLTYISEVPYAYTSPDDRYLAFSDMMFDLLAPDTAQRHRALVRLEDVGPTADPQQLREIADMLHREQVPFSIALYPVYRDPQGIHNDGQALEIRLRDRPEVVAALKYMVERGGTIVLHGYTHQYDTGDNPYDGRSGNDYEFYRAHVDDNDHVQLDGPVAEDSPQWTRQRIQAAEKELAAAGIPRPQMFEFPHYAGSANDYQVVADEFHARYDRGMYFPGVLTEQEPDYEHPSGQFVPYLVRDVYGSVVVPENLGQVTLDGYNQHPARTPEDLVATAERNLVVRDGVASFFYHPYLGTEHLQQIVTGVKELGYEFVPAHSVVMG